MACIMLGRTGMSPPPLPHEKLLAYRVALELLQQIQKLNVSDAKLRDQIQRAAKSVCLNIAEGVGRFSDADRRRVYAIARGECCEVAAAIDIARATGDCHVDHGCVARDTAGRVYALLTGLVRRYDFDTGDSKNAQLHEHARGDEHDASNEDGHQHDAGNKDGHQHDADNEDGRGHDADD
ncbi:MAG: four helix bundle protein [Myxococcales bacterium]